MNEFSHSAVSQQAGTWDFSKLKETADAKKAAEEARKVEEAKKKISAEELKKQKEERRFKRLERLKRLQEVQDAQKKAVDDAKQEKKSKWAWTCSKCGYVVKRSTRKFRCNYFHKECLGKLRNIPIIRPTSSEH